MFHPTLAVPITLLDRACMVSVIGIAIAYGRDPRTRLVRRPVKRYVRGQRGTLSAKRSTHWGRGTSARHGPWRHGRLRATVSTGITLNDFLVRTTLQPVYTVANRGLKARHCVLWEPRRGLSPIS